MLHVRFRDDHPLPKITGYKTNDWNLYEVHLMIIFIVRIVKVQRCIEMCPGSRC